MQSVTPMSCDHGTRVFPAKTVALDFPYDVAFYVVNGNWHPFLNIFFFRKPCDTLFPHVQQLKAVKVMKARISNAQRRKALRSFKQRGLVVHVGALEQLFQVFSTLDEEDFLKFVEPAIELLSGPGGSTDGIFTKALASSIGERIKRGIQRREGDNKARVEVIDCLHVPSWRPHAVATTQLGSAGRRIQAPKRPIINGTANSKADMFRTRYELIFSKTLRNPKFRPSASGNFSSRKGSPYYELTGIESLSGSKGDKLVLGMLTQLEQGVWYLEDLNGDVKIDLSDARVTSGMHTEGSFVIVQGQILENDGEEPVFKVHAMGTPPNESRDDSITALGRDANLFGGQFDANDAAHLLKIEEKSLDTVFLLISDVALDSSRVLAGLGRVWNGFLEDGVIPSMIVLMGNFLSHPFGQKPEDISTLCQKFSELGDMIKRDFGQLIGETTFVIIPGPNDPGPGNVLPRPPMPKMITRGFVEAVGSENVLLATNPCRVRFLTQEIVLLRDDIMQKMVRHCAVKPDLAEAGLMHAHLVKTVCDQSYLCPLPLSARPVLWAHNHALWLFPTPHVMVLADRVDSYICTYEKSLGVNPGSFKTDFSFLVYLPAQKRAQQSSLDCEDMKDAGRPQAVKRVQVDNKTVEANQSSQEEPDDNDPENEADILSDAKDSVNSAGENAEIANGADENGNPDLLSMDAIMDDKIEEQTATDNKPPSSQDDMMSEDGESDDDSHLAPLEGVTRLDIKTLVRNSLVEDSHPIRDLDSCENNSSADS